MYVTADEMVICRKTELGLQFPRLFSGIPNIYHCIADHGVHLRRNNLSILQRGFIILGQDKLLFGRRC
jgi:hypothetical protein